MSRTETDRDLERVIDYVSDHMAFEPDSYNASYLDRRISARMRRTDCAGYGEYLDVLSADEDERVALLDALSINVTGFFRNPSVWERLRDVLADLTDSRRSVRCWSAACADGREPYSIAMLARDDPDIRDRSLEVTATDIDAETLEVARKECTNRPERRTSASSSSRFRTRPTTSTSTTRPAPSPSATR